MARYRSTEIRAVDQPSNNPIRALAGLAPPDWTVDALCAQVDPEIFFPEKGGTSEPAKSICRRCPVAAECLDYALSDERGSYSSPFYYGIWGGLSERERRKIRRALNLPVPSEPDQHIEEPA